MCLSQTGQTHQRQVAGRIAVCWSVSIPDRLNNRQAAGRIEVYCYATEVYSSVSAPDRSSTRQAAARIEVYYYMFISDRSSAPKSDSWTDRSVFATCQSKTGQALGYLALHLDLDPPSHWLSLRLVLCLGLLRSCLDCLG
eukprot:g17304.t1